MMRWKLLTPSELSQLHFPIKNSPTLASPFAVLNNLKQFRPKIKIPIERDAVDEPFSVQMT